MHTEGKGQGEGEGEGSDTFIRSKIRFLLNYRIPKVYLFLASISPIIYKFQNSRILEQGHVSLVLSLATQNRGLYQ